MFDRPLGDIREEHLQELVDNHVREDKHLDYKETLDIKQPSERKEFCADVSSFANAEGGYIIYGMKKSTTDVGLSSEVCGLQFSDPGKIETQLGNILQTGLDPRLPASSVHIHLVPLSSNKKWVIVIHIQKSFRLPHMVKESGRFFSRTSTGKSPLDTTELRNAFELSGSLADHIRSFHTERLSRITACEELPAILDENTPKLVLHIIPLSAFNSTVTVNFEVLRCASDWSLMQTLYPSDKELDAARFNLDGIAHVFPRPSVPLKSRVAYTQVFRRGIIESVFDLSYLLPDALQNYGPEKDLKVFSGKKSELALLQGVKRYAQLQQLLGIEPPLFIMVSFLGVKNYKMLREDYDGHIFTGGARDKAILEEANIDRANLVIPEVLMDTFDSGNDHITKVMRPIFDTLWNARGHACSPYYDESGEYHTSF